MEVENLQAVINFLIQSSRFFIILIGGYFTVKQIKLLIDNYHDKVKNKDVIFIRKIIIGLSASIVMSMAYMFYGRIVTINPFDLLPSLIWLFMHLFMLAVFIYTVKRVKDINHNS